jgi:hypothetical protein
MLVTKNPGAIALAVMPSAASSIARQCMSACAPAFAAMYGRADRRLDLVGASDGSDDDPPEPAADACVGPRRGRSRRSPLRLMSITRFQRSSA